jgi:hypothetical protein
MQGKELLSYRSPQGQGETVPGEKKIVNILNKYFASVTTEEGNMPMPGRNNGLLQ